MYSTYDTPLRSGEGPLVGRFEVFLTYLPCSIGGWGRGGGGLKCVGSKCGLSWCQYVCSILQRISQKNMHTDF